MSHNLKGLYMGGLYRRAVQGFSRGTLYNLNSQAERDVFDFCGDPTSAARVRVQALPTPTTQLIFGQPKTIAISSPKA